MKILSITAQKPHSTGSGVYLTELVNAFGELGDEQAVIAGMTREDSMHFSSDVICCPVYYNSSNLPFPIVGMSDEMPYESTKYSEMTADMLKQFEVVFLKKITQVVGEFAPDVILCHHLYFLSALVRNHFPKHKVIAICHGTDIRQLKKTNLKREYIKTNIQKLDMIFALHTEQKLSIVENYHVESSKIQVIGSGYNGNLFRNLHLQKQEHHKKIIYAGKLSEKKGVLSLIRALDYLNYDSDFLTLCLAGGYGNQEEYNRIYKLAMKCKYNVKFWGKLNHTQLAIEFNKGNTFVLPSFYEGLPLVLLEALACGLQVVSTDLPGVREWMNTHIPENGILFVQLPTIENTDEPIREELPQFERRLAEAIRKSIDVTNNTEVNLNNLTWKEICKNIKRYIELG